MDKIKVLAEALYDKRVQEGWENVSMEVQITKATEYYRINALVEKLGLQVNN